MQISTKKVIGNAGALLAIQFANYLLPFLLTPYLTRTLGQFEYGIAALGFSIIQIGGVLTDYGFGIYATYLIAKTDNTPMRVNEIIGAVLTCKLILFIPTAVFVSAIPYIAYKYNDHKDYFLLLNLSILGITLQPIWAFQGLERMKAITIYSVLSRITFILLAIALVRNTTDISMVALANGTSQLLAASIALYTLRAAGYWPKWKNIRYTISIFKSSTEYFLSRAAVATYGAGATFYLGLASTPVQVSYYAVAEQFYRGAISLFSPISQALYPHMTKRRDIPLFRKAMKLSLIVTFLGVMLGTAIGNTLLANIFGAEYVGSYSTLVILLFALCAAIPSILLGYPFLGALGDNKSANRSVMYSGAIQIVLLSLCLTIGVTSAPYIAATVLCAEYATLTYRIISARKINRITIRNEKAD